MTARHIRTLTLPEIETLLGWAAGEGWNPGLSDAPAFQAADPEGFIGAFVGDEMAAAIAAVAYDDKFGFIGLYISHPRWRGQGHGKAVWDAGMARLGNRTIGLDGVPEQQANYASMGFATVYETVRMTGSLPKGGEAAPGITELTPGHLQALTVFDRQCFPAQRSQFLHHWLSPPNRGFAIVQDGSIQGCAVIRPCVAGSKIGPLFAEDLTVAKSLLAAASEAVDQPVQVDVPLTQKDLLSFLAANGFQPGFTTARMYRNAPPTIAMAKVYGITSLELG